MTDDEKREALAIGFPIGPYAVRSMVDGVQLRHGDYDELREAAQMLELLPTRQRDNAWVTDLHSGKTVYEPKQITEDNEC